MLTNNIRWCIIFKKRERLKGLSLSLYGKKGYKMSENVNITYPFNDDNMVFRDGRYYLTENALNNNGINLRKRLESVPGTNAVAVINRLVTIATNQIYNYIHSFNSDNNAQDAIIANTPSMRDIIYRALIAQIEYLLLKGDLTRSTDIKDRQIAIDESAKAELNRVIPELGVPITYAGGLRYGYS